MTLFAGSNSCRFSNPATYMVGTSVNKVEHESVVLFREAAGIIAHQTIGRSHIFGRVIHISGASSLVVGSPIGTASTHTVIDRACCVGIKLSNLQVRVATVGVFFGCFVVGAASGRIAALSCVGCTQEKIEMVEVFGLGDAFSCIVQIFDSFAVFLFAVAHLAHQVSSAWRGFHSIKFLGGAEEEIFVEAIFLAHDVGDFLQQIDIVWISIEFLGVDFHQLFARSKRRESGFYVGDILVNLGSLNAIGEFGAKFFVEEVACNVVVVDY